MTKEIAAIMKERIAGLPFLELVAGIAQPVIDKKFKDGDNARILKKMPVSYDNLGGKDPIIGMERQLVPNANRKSIVYFEDYGTATDSSGRFSVKAIPYISNIRLVCWMNKQKLMEDKYAEVTAKSIAALVGKLVTGRGINAPGITRLFFTVTKVPIQDANIFARYSYDEAEMQYLRPPYEYFAIDFTAKYTVVSGACF